MKSTPAEPLRFQVALYESAKHNVPHQVSWTWDQLAEELLEIEFTKCTPCIGKDCEQKQRDAWSPVAIRAGELRANANIESISMSVFDLDHLDLAELDSMRQ